MLAAAPNGGNPGTIPNEDSQGFEFDDTSLFVPNRFPGFDRREPGRRNPGRACARSSAAGRPAS